LVQIPVLTGDEDIGVAQSFWKRRSYFDLWHYLPKTICPSWTGHPARHEPAADGQSFSLRRR